MHTGCGSATTPRQAAPHVSEGRIPRSAWTHAAMTLDPASGALIGYAKGPGSEFGDIARSGRPQHAHCLYRAGGFHPAAAVQRGWSMKSRFTLALERGGDPAGEDRNIRYTARR